MAASTAETTAAAGFHGCELKTGGVLTDTIGTSASHVFGEFEFLLIQWPGQGKALFFCLRVSLVACAIFQTRLSAS